MRRANSVFERNEVFSDYLDEINRYDTRGAWPKPDRCALLVIDMQQLIKIIAGVRAERQLAERQLMVKED